MKRPLVILSWLSLALSPAVAKDDNPEVPKVEQKLSEKIQGIWELKFADGSRRLKYIIGGMWTITHADPETGKVIFHHGGSYTLDGGTYVEKVEFANENTANLVGAKHTFKVSVDGKKLSQVGVGNPWTEEWTRVKR